MDLTFCIAHTRHLHRCMIAVTQAIVSTAELFGRRVVQADVDRLEAAVAAAKQQVARHNQELTALEERRRAVQVPAVCEHMHTRCCCCCPQIHENGKCSILICALRAEGAGSRAGTNTLLGMSLQADYNGQVREHAKTVQQLEAAEAAREAAEQQVCGSRFSRGTMTVNHSKPAAGCGASFYCTSTSGIGSGL